MFGPERLVALLPIGADAVDLDPEGGKISQLVAKVAGLAGTPRRIILGIEEKDDSTLGEIVRGHRDPVAISKFYGREGGPDGDHTQLSRSLRAIF
jgi:hypothetical protein